MNGTLFIVSGPTGVGKTTLIENFIQECGALYNIKRCVAFTTRKPRKNEVNGKDYHFISQDEFDQKIEQNFFLEWSDVYIYKYGTPKSILHHLEVGQSYILIIDRAGTKKILDQYKDVSIVTLFITVSTLDILINRLSLRNSEAEEVKKIRLSRSFDEIKNEKNKKLYQFTIINDDYVKSFDALKSLFKQVFFNLKKIIEKT
jgi:guanylate kinase